MPSYLFTILSILVALLLFYRSRKYPSVLETIIHQSVSLSTEIISGSENLKFLHGDKSIHKNLFYVRFSIKNTGYRDIGKSETVTPFSLFCGDNVRWLDSNISCISKGSEIDIKFEDSNLEFDFAILKKGGFVTVDALLLSEQDELNDITSSGIFQNTNIKKVVKNVNRKVINTQLISGLILLGLFFVGLGTQLRLEHEVYSSEKSRVLNTEKQLITVYNEYASYPYGIYQNTSNVYEYSAPIDFLGFDLTQARVTKFPSRDSLSNKYSTSIMISSRYGMINIDEVRDSLEKISKTDFPPLRQSLLKFSGFAEEFTFSNYLVRTYKSELVRDNGFLVFVLSLVPSGIFGILYLAMFFRYRGLVRLTKCSG